MQASTVQAAHEKRTPRFDRYSVEENGEGIVGNFYVPIPEDEADAPPKLACRIAPPQTKGARKAS